MINQTTLHEVLLSIQTGKSFQTAEVPARPDEFGVLKVSAITWSDFRADEAKALKEVYQPEENHKVRCNDLLISRANTKEFVGAVVLVDSDYPFRLLSDKTLRLVIDEKRANKEYLLFALRSQAARKHIEHFATGTSDSMRNISQTVIMSIPISLPPLADQRRIAARLKAQFTAVEEARNAAQTQLEDSRKLIPSILKAAFTETTHAETVKIGDVARTTSGTTPSREHREYWQPAEYPWIKTGEIAFEPIKSTAEKVSVKALKECSLSLLPIGTVLVAMYGQGKTRGQSAVLATEATTNQACFAILPNSTFDPEYLQLWLRYSYEELRTLSDARGGNQSNLNGTILNQFEVPLIPREKQQQIVKQIKTAIAEAQTIQNTLQQQLAEINLLPSKILAKAFDCGAT